VSAVRTLGAAALVLGAAAPFVGSPYGAGQARIDIDSMAATIVAGDDHVSALQLAQWIREKKSGLKVIDVRSPEAFAAFSIPGAENIPIEAVGKARFAPTDTVVLYSEGGAHAAQAWVFLKARGVARAYFIAGGLADWRDEVMSPVLPADASPEAVAAFAPIAQLSLYFGGSPKAGPAGAAATRMTTTSAAADLASIRRRGC
jgi:rhodanese-related sulfurtransferase